MKISRRQFLIAASLAAPGLVLADARLLEPTWLKVRTVRLDGPPVGCRCIHFSDIHHKGDREYLLAVVARINSLKPDFVCFTGDLMENKKFLEETLEIVSTLQAPVFGVPGNHEYSSRAPFGTIIKYFAGTGGAFLLNQHREIAGGKINVIGITYGHPEKVAPASNPGTKNILLMHYPAWVKRFDGQNLDLILAGHSHGGQVRIPFYGPILLPFDVDKYDMGLFETAAGLLYVNPGIGYLHNLNFRFNCRPEITIFDV